MDWQGVLKRFGIRFAICLVVLGGVYVAVFGPPWASQNKPKTNPQRIAALRTAINQSYISSIDISRFREYGPISHEALNSLSSQLNQSNKALKQSLEAAPRQVNPELRKRIQVLLNDQNLLASDFATVYNVLDRTIAYNPSEDLGSVDIDKDSAKLQNRAQAAHKGLQAAANDSTAVSNESTLSVQANNGTPMWISPQTKASLLGVASCMEKLAQQASVRAPETAATRTQCIKLYPAVREQAIKNVVSSSLPPSKLTKTKQTVTTLLEQLDALLKKTD